MTDQGFLVARIDADGGPETRADHARVAWWSFTKTALAAAALQLVGRGYFHLDERINSSPFTLRQLLQSCSHADHARSKFLRRNLMVMVKRAPMSDANRECVMRNFKLIGVAALSLMLATPAMAMNRGH
jgi:hypothetical protein